MPPTRRLNLLIPSLRVCIVLAVLLLSASAHAQTDPGVPDPYATVAEELDARCLAAAPARDPTISWCLVRQRGADGLGLEWWILTEAHGVFTLRIDSFSQLANGSLDGSMKLVAEFREHDESWQEEHRRKQWEIRLALPRGEPLTTGVFTAETGSPPGLEIGGVPKSLVGCRNPQPWLEITRVRIDGAGRIDGLGADFELRCDAGGRLRGRLCHRCSAPSAGGLELSAQAPTLVVEGGRIRTRVTVANAGMETATGLVLSQLLATGLEPGAARAKPGACEVTARLAPNWGSQGSRTSPGELPRAVHCGLGDLAPGERAEVVLETAVEKKVALPVAVILTANEQRLLPPANHAVLPLRALPLRGLSWEIALYGAADAGGASRLYRFDLLTGAATAVGPIGFDRCRGLAFVGDRLVALCRRPGTDPERAPVVLVAVDPASGAGRELGETGLPAEVEIGDLAVSPDGVLYAAVRPDALWRIDPANGAATPTDGASGDDSAGGPGYCGAGIVFNAQGRLLGAGSDGRFGFAVTTDVFEGRKRVPLAGSVHALARLPGTDFIVAAVGPAGATLAELRRSGRILTIAGTVEGLAALAFPPGVDLAVTLDDGLRSAAPGSELTYTVTVSNAGSHAALGAGVHAELAAALDELRWSCRASAGGRCALGPVKGPLADTVDLPAGGTLTYTVTGVVAAAFAGTLQSRVTVAPPPGSGDPNPTDNSSADLTAVGGTGRQGVRGTLQVVADLLRGVLVYEGELTNDGPLPQRDNAGPEFVVELPQTLQLEDGLVWHIENRKAWSQVRGSIVSWNGALDVGQSVRLRFAARPVGGFRPGESWSVRGEVRYDADGDGINESQVATDDPRAPGIADPAVWGLPGPEVLLLVPLVGFAVWIAALVLVARRLRATFRADRRA